MLENVIVVESATIEPFNRRLRDEIQNTPHHIENYHLTRKVPAHDQNNLHRHLSCQVSAVGFLLLLIPKPWRRHTIQNRWR